MSRVSYQNITNIVLGKPKKSTKKKNKPVKGAKFSPQSTPYTSPVPVTLKTIRPTLTLKF